MNKLEKMINEAIESNDVENVMIEHVKRSESNRLRDLRMLKATKSSFISFKPIYINSEDERIDEVYFVRIKNVKNHNIVQKMFIDLLEGNYNESY